MNAGKVKCTFCGHQYDPDRHLACQSCPLHSGCNLVCCPACGYQTVDPHRSILGRFAKRFSRRKAARRRSHRVVEGITLADIPPGRRAEVIGFAENFPADRKAYLQAYGLVLRQLVQVVQHRPVTIIRLDHVELALENELASGIQVQLASRERTARN